MKIRIKYDNAFMDFIYKPIVGYFLYIYVIYRLKWDNNLYLLAYNYETNDCSIINKNTHREYEVKLRPIYENDKYSIIIKLVNINEEVLESNDNSIRDLYLKSLIL